MDTDHDAKANAYAHLTWAENILCELERTQLLSLNSW
jgi:hypothetical protein